MPDWFIATSYFVHMVATVVWVGGISLMALVVYPGVRRVLGGGPQAGAVLGEIQRRFSPLAMVSLAALVVTGLTQMAASRFYTGFLTISNTWAAAILLKHLAFLVMAFVGVYSLWVLTPTLARLALLESRGNAARNQLLLLRRREENLNQLNFVCGLTVLFFTAIARAV